MSKEYKIVIEDCYEVKCKLTEENLIGIFEIKKLFDGGPQLYIYEIIKSYDYLIEEKYILIQEVDTKYLGYHFTIILGDALNRSNPYNKEIKTDSIDEIKGLIVALWWKFGDDLFDYISIEFVDTPLNFTINYEDCPDELNLEFYTDPASIVYLLVHYYAQYNEYLNEFLPLSNETLVNTLIEGYDIIEFISENKRKEIIDLYWPYISENVDPYLVKNLIPIIKEYM